jgi:hypothetical protein
MQWVRDIDLERDRLPDGTTLCKFLHFLRHNNQLTGSLGPLITFFLELKVKELRRAGANDLVDRLEQHENHRGA